MNKTLSGLGSRRSLQWTHQRWLEHWLNITILLHSGADLHHTRSWSNKKSSSTKCNASKILIQIGVLHVGFGSWGPIDFFCTSWIVTPVYQISFMWLKLCIINHCRPSKTRLMINHVIYMFGSERNGIFKYRKCVQKKRFMTFPFLYL